MLNVNLPNGKDEWLTPPEIIELLGTFDLDPCAPVSRPWPTARHHMTKCEDGLKSDWYGRVWMNPPYGRETHKWLKKLKNHGDGLALIYARTETKMFFDYVWNGACAIFFIKGRLRFYHVDGTKSKTSGGAPSCLIAYGYYSKTALKNLSGIPGHYISLF